jgi:hypothetical protein
VTVPARLFDAQSGKLIREFDVAIENLRSPYKDSIRRITIADQLRWDRIENAARRFPSSLPPIAIIRGTRGVKVEDITFDFGAGP